MDWLTEAINAEAAAAPEPPKVVEAVKGRVVHIDGDYLAYFAAGGDEMPVGTARRVAADRIEAFREMAGAERAVVHLTMSGSNKGERALAATVKPYQGNRVGGKKPKNWAAMRDYLENASYARFVRKPWLDREADDGMALASFTSTDPEALVAIASKDKDMRMLAGRHLDWDTYVETVVPFGAYEVLNDALLDEDGDPLVFGQKWFWMQMLMGDTADHIPGLPRLQGTKCGKKTAAEALAGTTCNREAWDVVAKGYHDHYGKGWSDRMAEQACLLWLRTDDDAAVDNFLTIAPLHKAAARLKSRVIAARAQLDLYQTPHQ